MTVSPNKKCARMIVVHSGFRTIFNHVIWTVQSRDIYHEVFTLPHSFRLSPIRLDQNV